MEWSNVHQFSGSTCVIERGRDVHKDTDMRDSVLLVYFRSFTNSISVQRATILPILNLLGIGSSEEQY